METLGENGTLIRKKSVLTFSGAPIIFPTNVPASDSITVFDGGFTEVNFTVLDVNGNPMAAANSISTTVTGIVSDQVVASGDVGVTTIDSRNPANGGFKVRFSDILAGGGSSGNFIITISVSGPNGSTNKRLYGHLNAPATINPPSPSAKYPAQIAFLGVSNTDISVAGTGANENTVITYEVRDSLGSPIDADHRTTGTFTLQFFPNSFVAAGSSPRLIPSIDSTDDQGKLRVSVVSGTTSGVVQVVASIVIGGKTIKTSPVKINVNAGFPDQRHFTVAGDRHNFPGLDGPLFPGSDQTISMRAVVQVADKYSNPVQQGTAVYLHTSHGAIQTQNAITDADGFVKKSWFSGNPFPTGVDSLPLGQGWSRMFAETFGDSGVKIIDSIAVLWTGRPIFTLTSGPTSFTQAQVGSTLWTFKVADRLGHPLSVGTTMSVTSTVGRLDGNVFTSLGDNVAGGNGITDFSVLLSDDDPTDANPVPKTTLVKIAISHPVYGAFEVTFATGTVD
jgi:hypothetical protein